MQWKRDECCWDASIPHRMWICFYWRKQLRNESHTTPIPCTLYTVYGAPQWTESIDLRMRCILRNTIPAHKLPFYCMAHAFLIAAKFLWDRELVGWMDGWMDGSFIVRWVKTSYDWIALLRILFHFAYSRKMIVNTESNDCKQTGNPSNGGGNDDVDVDGWDMCVTCTRLAANSLQRTTKRMHKFDSKTETNLMLIK